MRDEPAGSTEKGLGREMPLGRGLRSGSDVGASPRNALTRGGTASGEASGTDRYARTALTRPPVDASSRDRWGESPRDSEYSASLRRLAPGVKRKLPTVETKTSGELAFKKRRYQRLPVGRARFDTSPARAPDRRQSAPHPK